MYSVSKMARQPSLHYKIISIVLSSMYRILLRRCQRKKSIFSLTVVVEVGLLEDLSHCVGSETKLDNILICDFLRHFS